MSCETNLTDARWKIIAEFIEDRRRRKYSLSRIIDAVLYVVKTGCQWRYLPLDFPCVATGLLLFSESVKRPAESKSFTIVCVIRCALKKQNKAVRVWGWWIRKV